MENNKESKKARLNLLIDADLKQWAHDYAWRNHTTITAILIERLVELRNREEGPDVNQI